MLAILETYYGKLQVEYHRLGKPQTPGQRMHAKRVKDELDGVLRAIVALKKMAEDPRYVVE